MGKLVLFIIFTFLSTTLLAKEITVARVTSDIERDVVHIVLETDSHNELTYLHTDTFLNNSFVMRNTHSFENIDNGFVILKKDKYNVVTLYSDDFVSYAGGKIKIKYMTSGLTNSYKSKYFMITQTDSSWELTNTNSKTLKGFFFKAKKIFGKIVGIKDIIFKY